ncbi:DUF2064 domain-containing protein [Chloroflexus sp.]|uniref:DUF2064 domain-containing protein n=1 Tax=Chloroflexus sp. TaxID=1904827 RepID=UPI00404A7120
MQRTTLILDRSSALRETFGIEASWWSNAFVTDLQALVLRVTGIPAHITTTIQIAAGAIEEPLLILSGDTPHLPENRIRDAYTLLANGVDVVIGLCDRGGWYALGARQSTAMGRIPVTLEELRPWLDGLQRRGLQVAHLPLWFRITYPSDLATLAVALRTMPSNYAPTTRHLLGDSANALEREWGA